MPATHRKHPPSGTLTLLHITVQDALCNPGVISWGNGVIYFFSCMHFPLNLVHFYFSKQFPTLPGMTWESPEKPAGPHCIRLWVMNVGGETKTNSNSIKSKVAWTFALWGKLQASDNMQRVLLHMSWLFWFTDIYKYICCIDSIYEEHGLTMCWITVTGRTGLRAFSVVFMFSPVCYHSWKLCIQVNWRLICP